PSRSTAPAPRRAVALSHQARGGVSARDAFAAELARRAEAPQRFRHGDAAVRVLEVLHERDERPRRDRGAVERVHVLEPAVAARTDVEPARLVIGRVRRRRELAVALLPGEPALDVVLLRRRRAQVARRDVHDAVRQVEVTEKLLLDCEQALVLVARPLGGGEDEHLDLVELVHAEHPAGVLACGARLAAEVRRVARVAQRERVGVEDLLHVHGREPDLGRAGEVQLVALDLVDVHLLGGEEAGAVHRLLADEDRRKHGHETLRNEAVERVAVQRELEQRDVADAVRETRARHLRRTLHVDPPERLCEVEVVARGKVERRRIADDAHDDRIVLGEAVRRLVVGRVGYELQDRLPPCLRLLELLLEPLQLRLHPLELRELLGRRLALQLASRTELLHLRLHGEHRAVGLEQLVEELGRALARKLLPDLLRLVAGSAQIDHRRESRNASSRTATPSSWTGGMTRSARRRMSSCAFATATPKPPQSSSSRSFSPSPRAMVWAAVNPSRSATNCRPAPLLTSGCANSRK